MHLTIGLFESTVGMNQITVGKRMKYIHYEKSTRKDKGII
jgi:hypothetical protein